MFPVLFNLTAEFEVEKWKNIDKELVQGETDFSFTEMLLTCQYVIEIAFSRQFLVKRQFGWAYVSPMLYYRPSKIPR